MLEAVSSLFGLTKRIGSVERALYDIEKLSHTTDHPIVYHPLGEDTDIVTSRCIIEALSLSPYTDVRLDLSQKRSATIMPISMRQIECMLSSNRPIIELDLSNRQSSLAYLQLLASSTGWGSFQTLSLNHCSLGSKEAALFKYVRLNLDDNKIGDAGVRALSRSFNRYISVKYCGVRESYL
jgi:hypothetical protein